MKIRSFFIYTCMLLVILLIFSLSRQNSTISNALSKEITHLVQDYLPLSNSQMRDLGHIGLFFILGMICMIPTLLSLLSYKKAACFTLLLGAMTALCDELIQLGSIGRAFEWVDIGKDMGGIVASIVIIGVIGLVYHTFKRNT